MINENKTEEPMLHNYSLRMKPTLTKLISTQILRMNT